MSDNVAVTAGTGTTIAADEVVDGTLGTVKVQYVKIMDGTLDSTTKISPATSGNQTTGNTSLSSIDTKTPALSSGRVPVDGSGVTQPVSLASVPTHSVTHTDTAPATQNITAADAASSTTSGANSQSLITGTPTANSAASFTLSGQTSVVIQATGTWVATLQVELSMDGGTTWVMRGVHQAGTSYTAVSFTGNFTGGTNVAGYTNVRVRATAYTSGTATIRVTETLNLNSVYIANSVKLSDATIPSQQLSIDSTGAISVQSAGSTGSSVPTRAIQMGGSDGTNLRAAKVDSSGNQYAVIVAATTGGYTPGKLVSAASTNATSIKGSAGTLGFLTMTNSGSAPASVKFYNKATAPTVGTDTPVHTFVIPANATTAADEAGSNPVIPSEGINFTTGIALAITALKTDADTTAVAANQVVVNYGTI